MAKKIITFVLTIAAGIAGIVFYVKGCINNITFFLYAGIFALWFIALIFAVREIEDEKTKKIFFLFLALGIYAAGLIGFIVACRQQLGFWTSTGRFIIWFIAAALCNYLTDEDILESLSAADAQYNSEGHMKKDVSWRRETSASGNTYDVRTTQYVQDTQNSALGYILLGIIFFPISFLINVINTFNNSKYPPLKWGLYFAH